MERMQSSKPSKRLDLQGIRGLAIIVVLGFHFYPNIFPNGYLGVDQFFVLSGFLMCMLLKRGGGGGVNMQSCSLITLFYSKRFKRILPLYLLIILLSLLSLYTIFPDTAIATNKMSAEQALLFVSNRPKSVQENYFKMLKLAEDMFTHTWSLSVEVQFYCIVPLIFIVGSVFSINFQYVYYSLIALCSLFFYFYSDATVAFNSVFGRIWQFLIGMIVYMINDSDSSYHKCYQLLGTSEEEVSELLDVKVDEVGAVPNSDERPSVSTSCIFNQTSKYICLLSIVYTTTYPLPLPSSLARIYVTFSTGLLMLISMDDYLLSNRILTYIGDISYSLYLIHWPIYAYWKLTMNDDQQKLLFCLISSFVLAIVVFELFEKWYLSLSSVSIGILVASLYAFSILLLNKDELMAKIPHSDVIDQKISLDQADEFNKYWNFYDYENLRAPTCVYENIVGPLGWCNHTGLDSNSKYKIMIFGNSWTANHAKMFYQECHDKANMIIQGSAYGCEPLYHSLIPTWEQLCVDNVTDFETRIKLHKPDYAFMLTRYISLGDPFPKGVNNLNDDPVYQFMKSQLLKILPNIKYKLYILDVLPQINALHVDDIVPMLKNKTHLVVIDKMLVNYVTYKMARARFDKMFEDCGDKCIRINYIPEFYNKKTHTFRYFDESNGLSYFTSPSHLSPHGIEKIRHIYRDICTNQL